MALGIRIRNTSGDVQIDNSYQNLALRSKGTVVSGAAAVGALGWSQATITVPATAVIAYRCTSLCYFMSSSPSGGTKTVTFWVQGLSVSVDWYAFDTPDLGQSYGGNFGLLIRTPTGAVAFDSRKKYMRVIDQIAGGGTSAAVNENHNYGGAVPAIMPGLVRYYATFIPLTGTGNPTDPPAQYVFWGLSGSTSGSSVTIADGNAGAHTYDRVSQAPAGLAQAQYYYDLLVIDVNNF